ncbi:MAG: hypothetical protein PWQ67_767 [Clostridia bacterium]|jgi:hypothetical protein|nr:hypothetical protein [Clostridia bacterium]MDN5322313.1 hypothetical protein [Clostridia bacterium]
MVKKFKVGFKFCGNCNPYIETQQLLLNLKKELKDEVDLVFWENQPYNALLILSGCLSDCAERPDFSGPTIVVAGNTLDHFPLEEENLKTTLIKKIELMKSEFN